jgi:hypothetical protein
VHQLNPVVKHAVGRVCEWRGVPGSAESKCMRVGGLNGMLSTHKCAVCVTAPKRCGCLCCKRSCACWEVLNTHGAAPGAAPRVNTLTGREGRFSGRA